jgi:hypothetical protein
MDGLPLVARHRRPATRAHGTCPRAAMLRRSVTKIGALFLRRRCRSCAPALGQTQAIAPRSRRCCAETIRPS